LQVEQNSYLLSGGLLGLALVIAGGFFYFGYWLTRQFYESRKHNERLVTALTAIESRLADQPTGPVAVITQPAEVQPTSGEHNGTLRAPRPLRARPVTAVATDIPMLVATPNGTMLHRPDCPVVANRDGLHRVPADSEGYTPCQICQPLSAEQRVEE
jgi:hypothetical protein